jgi:hypothetical protein
VIEAAIDIVENILGGVFFVDLKNMNRHAASSGKLLMTNMTLKVLGFLMLNQDLLVIEFMIAVIITPDL